MFLRIVTLIKPCGSYAYYFAVFVDKCASAVAVRNIYGRLYVSVTVQGAVHGNHTGSKSAGGYAEFERLGITDCVYGFSDLRLFGRSRYGFGIFRCGLQNGDIEGLVVTDYFGDCGGVAVVRLYYAAECVLDNVVVRYERTFRIDKEAAAAC